MKKAALFLLTAALMASMSAWASPLSSYTHHYGSGQFDPDGQDKLSPGYVTLQDKNPSTYHRFSDAFDFSALNFTSVDHFDLTITYSNTNGFFESWYARPGRTEGFGSFGLNWTDDRINTETFTVSSTLREFDKMITDKKFSLLFAEQGPFSQNFKLYSTRLDIYGQAAVLAPAAAVPEPNGLALFGLCLATLTLLGHRKASD